MSLLDLSRWQFAITVLFYVTLAAITVGLLVPAMYGPVGTHTSSGAGRLIVRLY
jgi:hypothetical protein